MEINERVIAIVRDKGTHKNCNIVNNEGRIQSNETYKAESIEFLSVTACER